MESQNDVSKVAVLLATYNGRDRIKEQIDSILVQSDVDVHIFLSDDCSTDGTVEYVQTVYPNHKCISIDSQGRKFGSAGKNFFSLISRVDVSKFDFVCFSDQDDIWFKDKIAHAIKCMVDRRFDGYSSDVIAYWPLKNRQKLIIKSWGQTKNDYWFESPGPGCTHVTKCENFLIFQQFVVDNYTKITNNIEYHDWLIYAYFRFNNFRWLIDDQPKMYYVQHDNNQMGANSGLSGIFKRAKLIASGWYRNQVENTSEIIYGHRENLITRLFIIKNFSNLRRRKIHSFITALSLLLF